MLKVAQGFTGVDPLADHPNQIMMSPYQYAWGDPVSLTDPDGRCPNCGAAVLGGAIGGLIGGGIEIASQLYNEGTVSDWKAVGGSAAQGAITGAAAGFTGGASLLTTAGAATLGNVAGGVANREIQGQETTVADVAMDAAVGGGLGVLGAGAGKVAKAGLDRLSPSTKGKIGEAVTEAKWGLRGFRSRGKSNVPTGGRTRTGRRQVARYDHDMENVFTGSRRTVESKFNKARLSRNQRNARGNITTPGGLILDRTTSQQAATIITGGTLGTAGHVRKKIEQ